MMGAGYTPSWQDHIEPYLQRCDWKLAFALLPHKCTRSQKRIWLTHAYKGTRTIYGPGEPIIEYHWITKEEFILWRLTHGNI